MKQTVTALIVHDSEVMLRHLSTLLQKQGLQVSTAANPDIAVHSYSSAPTDIVLSALAFSGGISGFDLVAKLPQDKRPKGFAVLAPATISPEERNRAKEVQCRLLPKLVQRKEEDFTQELFFWLKELGLIS